jgi:hypothetical protein
MKRRHAPPIDDDHDDLRAPPFVAESLEPRRLLSAQAYDWQNANIGAGGFVDGIFFDPSHQNTMYARTDIGGLFKTTNAGATWSELLDFVNNQSANSYEGLGVLAFAMDPQNTSNLYLSTGMYTDVNGWLLRSTDGGHTFTRTNLPFYVGGNSNGRATGERLAVDPNLGSTLFLGSNNHGLYESTNSGATVSPVNSFPLSAADIDFVTFDPTSGTAGHASQTIYVGVDSTAAGTNIYRSTDGGTTWSELAGGPTALIPMRGLYSSNGYMYFTFANALPPGGNLTTGSVWRYSIGAAVWTNISPQAPGGSNPAFGYDGIAIDPQNPSAVVVTSFDRYSGPDTIWRTANATAASPAWIQLFDPSSAQNFGFGGFNTTRNTSAAPWVAAFGDGIGNWAAAVAIDPFNSAHLLYGTGQGLWATDHGNSSTKLTAANSWYFPDTGIEFTAVTKLIAPPSGTPLFSSMGDINGFAHTSLANSPAAGGIAGAISNGGLGTMTSIDFAQSNPNTLAIVGSTGTNSGAYSTNNGTTWTEFASRPSGASNGTVAVSANGSRILWAPSNGAPSYSTNNGATWTASTTPSGTLAGGTVVSDRINSSVFYYWTENAGDNSWTFYSSADGGHTFTKGVTMGIGNVTLVPNPGIAGDLWISTYIGVYHSTNFGATFTQLTSVGSANIANMALGKAAIGATYPAIYIYGSSGNFTGMYRSDDGGSTWTLINTIAQQWGGLITTMAADPNTYGRVYLGINGRGIIYGDIHDPPTALPAGWSSADIGSPGSAGSAGFSGSTWELIGGGSGITGASDQFRFAYQSLTGDGSITAQVLSVPLGSPGNYSAQAAVMIRDGLGANAVNALVGLTPGSVNGAHFTRRAAGGASTSANATATTGVYPPYWVRLVRSGNSFTAFISRDAVTWTQLGTAQVISMNSTVDIGLAVTASNNNQLNIATFSNVTLSGAPAVAINSVAPNPRSSAVSTLTIAFSEPVTGFDLSDLTLARDGGAVSLSGATLTTADGGVTFLLGNLTAMTANAGSYVLTLTAGNSGITNRGAVPLATSASASWLLNTVIGTTSADSIGLTGNATSVTVTLNGASYSVNLAPIGQLIINGQGGYDNVQIGSGVAVTLATNQILASLSVASGASASMTPGGDVLVTRSLQIDGRLDVADDGVIIDYTGTSPIASIRAALAAGFNAGLWNGNGIASTSAAADANSQHALGYAEASDLAISAFMNHPVDNSAVVIRYALYGDNNLDGAVDIGNDFDLLLDGLSSAQASSWLQGDYTYDGKVDLGNDFNLFLRNFLAHQPPPVAPPLTLPASYVIAPAPKPVTVVAPTSSDTDWINDLLADGKEVLT